MDVDLLRPGTVPISPDTVLWFEFLLDPNLLKKHLSKTNPGIIVLKNLNIVLLFILYIYFNATYIYRTISM